MTSNTNGLNVHMANIAHLDKEIELYKLVRWIFILNELWPLLVCTKVYGFGVLTSSVSSDGVIHHNMEES